MQKEKIGYLISMVLAFTFMVGFGLLLIVVNNQYKKSTKSYDSYTKKTYTLVEVERVKKYKRSPIYEIYVKEESKPLVISSIIFAAVDKTAINSLKTGDILEVYIENNKNEYYSYDIVELKSNDKMVLSLNASQSKSKSNSLMGFIVVPVMSICSFGLFAYCYKKYRSIQ